MLCYLYERPDSCSVLHSNPGGAKQINVLWKGGSPPAESVYIRK